MDASKKVTVSTSVWSADSGGGWLAVEGPGTFPNPFTVPVIINPNHGYIRPYNIHLKTGSPDFGYVFHSLGTLKNRDPRLLSSYSLRRKRISTPKNIVPMDVTIYPGVSLQKPHTMKGGTKGQVHHISIRETTDGLQVYPHIITSSGVKRPRIKIRVNPNASLGGIIHLGQTLSQDWTAFDPCALVAARIPENIYEAKSKNHMFDVYPSIRSHAYANYDAHKTLKSIPNFLWQGYFLCQRELQDRDTLEILNFFNNHVNPHIESIQSNTDYDGPLSGRVMSVPLDFEESRAEPYRWLHTITSVVPGGLRSPTGIVGMADFLPFLSQDFLGNEDSYREYIAARYGRTI